MTGLVTVFSQPDMTTIETTTETKSIGSLWSPLQTPVFRSLWVASTIASLGLWMQDIAGAWLMTSLSPTPVMVSLMQTATYLPFFLLSLPAGALADILDRRLIVLFSQIWMFFAVLGLAALTLCGAMTAWMLILLIFILNLGGAMQAPAWNSMTPELVPESQLEPAIAIQSAGFNCARGLGAAFGGLITRQFGPGLVFLIDAAMMTVLGTAVFRWKREKTVNETPTERVLGAMKAGIRYVQHSRPLRAVLVRTALFVFCASAVWGLLPLLARTVIHLDSSQYGLTLTAFGGGTLFGAAILPRIRRVVSLDVLLNLGCALFAAGMFALAMSSNFALACVSMFWTGIGWMFSCNATYSAILMASPLWVRARGVAIYLLVFQGCIAVGSPTWGAVADRLSMPYALMIAAGILGLGCLANLRYRLIIVEQLDMRNSGPWPKVETSVTPHPDQGPVLVTIEYKIDPAKSADFAQSMGVLEKQRRRNGAFQWHLFINLSAPGTYTESFFVETWSEYLRQRDRATVDDIAAENMVCHYHIDSEIPKITRFISERRRSNQ